VPADRRHLALQRAQLRHHRLQRRRLGLRLGQLYTPPSGKVQKHNRKVDAEERGGYLINSLKKYYKLE
jgi:hypothetical protein